ncbi:ABC transporter ATP-binding protein [Blautia faecicola]|uniref:ABC transporter ATP-binding protein n=1 Tax=Blautia faecicola TaxID=2509240 RepID=A0A4Q1RHV1_9FIRM|nr:ABC transporter ATP-binding protein [Blautia faecicola]RXS75219.1 ABC transporter ATP-binding protein [Blautia faecicola]
MKKLLLRSLRDIHRIVPRTLVLQIICMMLQSLMAAITIWLTSVFLNLVYQKDFKSSLICFCMILAVFVLSEVANSIFYSCMVRIDFQTGQQLQIELGEKGTRLSMICYENTETNNMLKRAKNCIEQERFSDLSLSVFNILAEFLKVNGTLLVLAGFHPVLVGISLLSVFPYLIVRLVRGKEFYELKRYQAAGERRRNYLYHLFGDKQAVKELRIFEIEDYIEQKMYAARDNMKQEVWNFKKRDMRSLLICEIFCESGYLLSIFSTILLLLHQVLDVGMMAAALAAFTSFQTAAKYFLVSLGRIPECAAFVKDYYDFMDMEEAEKGTEKLCSDFDSIKVKQLSFSYPGRKTPAVSNLSFTIKRNEVVAIVGNNGSGKTTLVKLLTGLYQAQKGQIYYGRQNLRSLDPEEFYKQISFVSQDFIKYELTVRENIGIGDWKQMENTDKIYMLLHQVGLETFISQASVNQLLGNEFGGRELSVGQWQKLAIARGMMKDSSVIFLDEPTAALDPLMETKVLKMFLKIAREKTAIIVSHRIGICKEVDKIIVMKEGKIAEIGNHEELLAEKGEYYRLYTMQQKWYEE